MRALRLMSSEPDPVLVEVDEREPGPREVVIRVGGAGTCHADLQAVGDFEPGQLRFELPVTLGHENAGWVESLGEVVTGLEVGQPVAVSGPWECGSCPRSWLGMETRCENIAAAPVPMGGGGLSPDGGMAELMLVSSARFLVPADPEPAGAALLADAGLTL